ncbi:hypothetical protein EYC84_007688 [Monilinia fructicola]|uniref:Gfd2/YDR514C-like C-terminal domain-containing protein n=1 Tax=Monilinia fructicola TaxID=38448 RepID=A0A5M9JIY5_MONFR|nr:hypothetical protein EYC84_007688 [Monilinia fructicola]
MANRIDRLRALTGQQEVYDYPNTKETQTEIEEPFVLPEGFKIHARHIYEGSSEEDNTPPTARTPILNTSKRRRNAPKSQRKVYSSGDGGEDMTAGTHSGMNQRFHDPELGPNDFLEYKGLEYGQLAPEGESFCLWNTVTKYPYRYGGDGNKQKIVEHFFVGGKCYLQIWDFFYLYRLAEDSNKSPIILVPTKQVEYFLAVINRALGTSLTLPAESDDAFKAVFSSDGTLIPDTLVEIASTIGQQHTPEAHNFADLNTFYDPDHPSKFLMEDLVVFICVDVEAYEFNNKIITEIGIATLDVLDIVNMPPGALGENWRKAIRARHFRIKENMHLKNTKHVRGCADKFEFGKSEIISINDAPHVVGTCFKYIPSHLLLLLPSSETQNVTLSSSAMMSTLIFVFLRQVGYEVNNLKLHECCDTTLMWRALKREVNSRSLTTILAEIGITGWNLHNGGNDAVYTLQAMLGIACKHLVDRKQAQDEKDILKKIRISEAVKEAVELALRT